MSGVERKGGAAVRSTDFVKRHHTFFWSNSRINAHHFCSSLFGAVTLTTELVQTEEADKGCPLVSTQRVAIRVEKRDWALVINCMAFKVRFVNENSCRDK